MVIDEDYALSLQTHLDVFALSSRSTANKPAPRTEVGIGERGKRGSPGRKGLTLLGHHLLGSSTPLE